MRWPRSHGQPSQRKGLLSSRAARLQTRGVRSVEHSGLFQTCLVVRLLPCCLNGSLTTLALVPLQGCFTATTTATAADHVSLRASSALFSGVHALCHISVVFLLILPEDLANQIRFSAQYRELLRSSGQEPGRFLSVQAAEWFQGPLFNVLLPTDC